jgi:predicted nucleic acid-binding protein
MAILLDSGFFLALSHKKDQNNESAKKLFKKMAQGEFGLIYTTPYIISETSTLILVRTNNNSNLIHDFYELLFGSDKFVRILSWKEELDKKIWNFFITFNSKAKTNKEWLSFVDCSNIIYCKERNIENIATYDGNIASFLNVFQ